MAKLRPPLPAFRQGSDGHERHTLTSGRLTTTVPQRLRRRGYIPTWPAGAEVAGVAGVPNDAAVPPSTTIAQNTLTGSLYRRVNGEWLSVNGEE